MGGGGGEQPQRGGIANDDLSFLLAEIQRLERQARHNSAQAQRSASAVHTVQSPTASAEVTQCHGSLHFSPSCHHVRTPTPDYQGLTHAHRSTQPTFLFPPQPQPQLASERAQFETGFDEASAQALQVVRQQEQQGRELRAEAAALRAQVEAGREAQEARRI